MGYLFDNVEKYFTEKDWKYHKEESKGLLLMGISGHHGHWHSVAHVVEDQGQFLFFSLFPTKVPVSMRARAAEFITRVNYHLFVGGFDLDWSDGEIRYRTSLDLSDQNEIGSLVQQLVGCNLSTMDRFYRPLMSLLFGGKTATQALEEDTEDNLVDGIESWLSEMEDHEEEE